MTSLDILHIFILKNPTKVMHLSLQLHVFSNSIFMKDAYIDSKLVAMTMISIEDNYRELHLLFGCTFTPQVLSPSVWSNVLHTMLYLTFACFWVVLQEQLANLSLGFHGNNVLSNILWFAFVQNKSSIYWLYQEKFRLSSCIII